MGEKGKKWLFLLYAENLARGSWNEACWSSAGKLLWFPTQLGNSSKRELKGRLVRKMASLGEKGKNRPKRMDKFLVHAEDPDMHINDC